LANARRKTMAAFDSATLDRWRALAIVDRDGTTVGTISEFYLDRETGDPTWALVNTGLFGATQTFVPLVHATEISDGLQVPYQKNHIKDTPKVDLHDELSPQEEAELFAHYGVDYHPSQAPPTDPGSEEDRDAGPGSGDGDSPGIGTTGPASPAVVSATTIPTGEAPGPVPAEPGPTDPAEAADGQPAPAPSATTETAPAGPGPDDAASGQYGPYAPGSSAVPNEPGTTEPPEAPPSGSPGPGSHQIDLEDNRDRSGLAPPDLGAGSARSGGTPADLEEATPSAAAQPDPGDADRSTAGEGPSDPDLSRTAPVEPGLPGSTAASPYESGPRTIDKGDPPEASADAPPEVPDEAGWPPAPARTFDEQESLDQPAGASDRWREAKLAAERDRIARATAAQPEERSPLERARRRLERLVGVGQEHSDEISPADREAAERARRARLGLDEDDHTR
jgi:hypothetical protein